MSSSNPFGSRPLPPPVALPEFENPDARTTTPGSPPPPGTPPPPVTPPPPGPNGALPAPPAAPTTPPAPNSTSPLSGTLPGTPKAPPPIFGAPAAPISPNQQPTGELPGDDESIAIDELSDVVASVQARAIRTRLLLTGLLFVVGGLAIAAVWWATTRPATATPDEIGTAIDEAVSNTTVPEPVGPAIFNTLIPSMVLIQLDAGGDVGSIGTGVVINDQADIMTAFHVVDGEGEIRISFTDGTTTTATISESDPAIDIAVLSVAQPPEVLVPAVIGGGVAIGEPVFALGNPLGLTGSFSQGVVSGLDRSLPIDDDFTLEGLIQFDAAVNPGSSGGPLINSNGQVVGIVTALASPTGEDFFSGIGFAVPIATAGGAAGGPQQ